MGADYMDERARNDRLLMEQGRLAESGPEQSNQRRLEEAGSSVAERDRMSPRPPYPDQADAPFQREHVAETWQREATENTYSVIDELVDDRAEVKIDKNIAVHDFGMIPYRTVGKKGASLGTWRVIEFARDTSDLVHLRIRGEFAALDDAKEFLTLLRSNEVLEALANGPGSDASHT